MCLKRVEEKKLLVRHNNVAKWLLNYFLKYRKAVLFNSEYCEIFKSTYFEEHLRTTVSEKVFMKMRKLKIIHK